MGKENFSVIIPAYKPDNKLIKLCEELVNKYEIIIINDGSGEDYEHIFSACKDMGCKIITHDINKGKGRALKTGFQYAIDNDLWIVSADADGQHLAKDIINVGNVLVEKENKHILGVRVFDETTPLKSKFGNYLTRFIFRNVTGINIIDTQTGLRGFSPDMMKKFINLPGERYEYEMNMLLNLKKLNIEIFQEEIEVVYIGRNETSHFHVVFDSMKIYFLIIKNLFKNKK